MYGSPNRVAVSPSPREAGHGWVLDAVFPNGKQAAIAGFRTESDANDWLGSAGHVTWLRDARSNFCSRSVVATFEWLVSFAIAVSDLAAGFCQAICHRWPAVEAVRAGYRRISTTAQLHAAEWLRVASDVARCMIRRWGVGLSGSSFRHRTVYRRLLATTVALLMLVAVTVTLVAVLVMLGASERPARSGPGAIQFASDSPIVPSLSRQVTETSDPIALLIDRVSSSEITAERPARPAVENPPPQPTGDESPTADIHAAPARELPRVAPPTIVGVWAPETGSCSAREGVLPAIISERGARAGETSCVFKEQKRRERDWRVLANCTNGHEHWTSNVRLLVKGDRLVWTSKRGTQAYRRCKSNV